MKYITTLCVLATLSPLAFSQASSPDPRAELSAACRKLTSAGSYTAKVTIDGGAFMEKAKRKDAGGGEGPRGFTLEHQDGRPAVITLAGPKMTVTLWKQGDVAVVRDPSGAVHLLGERAEPRPSEEEPSPPPAPPTPNKPNDFLGGRPPHAPEPGEPGRKRAAFGKGGGAAAMIARLAASVPTLAPHALVAGIDGKIGEVSKQVAADGSAVFVAELLPEAARALLPGPRAGRLPRAPRTQDGPKESAPGARGGERAFEAMPIGATLQVHVDASGAPIRLVLIRHGKPDDATPERSMTTTFEISQLGATSVILPADVIKYFAV